MTSPTADSYRRFAELEARPSSPLYMDWAASISNDDAVLALIDALPRVKRQPNLVFAAARSAGAPEAGYPVFRRWLTEHWPRVEPVIRARQTQTNEAGRCAVLLPLLSRIEGPVALIEAGASAGLCLYPDRYSYRYQGPAGEHVLHPLQGPGSVELSCSVSGEFVPPRLPDVVSRAGVDLNPLDLRNPADTAWLETLVWPEHEERRMRLREAARVAGAEPPRIIRGDMVEALPQLVAEAPAEATVVVFHSSVLVYLEPEHRRRFVDLVRSLDVVWISNEGEQTVPFIADQLPGRARGRTVLALDGVPHAFAGPHGQSYEALNNCGRIAFPS